MNKTAKLKISGSFEINSAAARKERLEEHVRNLYACTRCPRMAKPVVSGGPVLSRVLLVGQAPGPKEPLMGKPFAWTAGRTLFSWFELTTGVTEELFRERVYMAAVCRCFPGKDVGGADRVPDDVEIANCRKWLQTEIELLEPQLVIAVGKLAIKQFIPCEKLDQVVGRLIPCTAFGRRFDLAPLPHPSGASTWHRMEPGKTLLGKALRRIKNCPTFIAAFHPSGAMSQPKF